MSEVFEWREAPQAEFAVIGDPIEHSLSPKMHQAIYDELGLPYRYVALRVDRGQVEEALAYLLRLGYTGVNVTVPHKKEALDWAHDADAFALFVQAANTLNLKKSACINTDAPGFLETLSAFDWDKKRALVLGAGGSSRAVVAALVLDGWSVAVHNRTQKRARELAALTGCDVAAVADPEGCSLLVNATSASLDAQAPAVLWEKVARGAVAYDLMYASEATPFLREAADHECRTVDGLSLLVAQGARSFEWWTGLRAPREAMTRALKP